MDALSRLSGVASVTIRLQDGIVDVAADAGAPVRPASLWTAIAGVGFEPVSMEITAAGAVRGDAVEIDGRRWRLARPAGPREGTLRLRVARGGEDPPAVEGVE